MEVAILLWNTVWLQILLLHSAKSKNDCMFLLTFLLAAVPVLLPYKPRGSEELFYVPQTEVDFSSADPSDTTMESSHTGTFVSDIILLSNLYHTWSFHSITFCRAVVLGSFKQVHGNLIPAFIFFLHHRNLALTVEMIFLATLQETQNKEWLFELCKPVFSL